jgi:hypothetical protein
MKTKVDRQKAQAVSDSCFRSAKPVSRRQYAVDSYSNGGKIYFWNEILSYNYEQM